MQCITSMPVSLSNVHRIFISAKFTDSTRQNNLQHRPIFPIAVSYYDVITS